MGSRGQEVSFSPSTFTFLEELEAHNTREWFAQHRNTYEDSVRLPFAEVLEEVSRKLARTKNPLRGGEHTMFRIQRDVRFSADKSPYSTHVSGVLTRTGKKDIDSALVYVHLDATGGFVAGGLYRPQAARLEPIRRAMLEHEKAFARVLDEMKKADLQFDDSEVTKTMPRGFADAADHRFAEFIRLKNMIAMRPLEPSDWIAGTAAKHISDFSKSVAPLLAFINAHE